MSGFAQIAKSLISQSQTTPISQPSIKSGDSREAALDHIKLLSDSGFSPKEVLRDLRELYDSCETDEKSIRLQISKLMIQVLGMLNSEDAARATPSFTLIIQGDNARVNTMLCPLG
jgi:hypothetical protein